MALLLVSFMEYDMLLDNVNNSNIVGRLQVNNGERTVLIPNQIQYGWGFAAAKLLATGNAAYRVSAMYIEFENVASSGDAVTPPTYARSEGQEYYEGLAFVADRDFIRASLLLPAAVSIEEGYEDYIPANEGNLLTFYTQTQGTVGYHGKAFSNAVNSKIFGAALVVTPVSDDPAKDIIVARTYLSAPNQVLKVAASQVGLTWSLSLI